MKKSIIILFFLLCFSSIYPCTSIIISGKITKDGRPILWKQRDAGVEQNLLKYFIGNKYDYAAITQTHTENPKSVWGGVNTAGFAIINTLSYNIQSGSIRHSQENGSIMKKALSECGTVKEFEELLNSLPKPLRISANYGVIDSLGNAVYYEVGDKGFVKFDVNNPEIAPKGYLVRTNYSLSGNDSTGAGYIRYLAATNMIEAALIKENNIPEYILTQIGRSFYNPISGINLKDKTFNTSKMPGWSLEQDFICRTKSTASICIEGKKPGLNNDFTIMWTIIGYPGTCIYLPVFVNEGQECIPNIIQKCENGKSWLADMAYNLKYKVYDFKFEPVADKEKYFNWKLLFNKNRTGYIQKIEKLEKSFLPSYYSAIKEWRKKGIINKEELKNLNKINEQIIIEKYKQF